MLSMARSGIHNCSVSVDGGGVYVAHLVLCSLYQEESARGGALSSCAQSTTTLSLVSSAISHNAADGLGGGAYIQQKGFLDAANDVNFSANTALSGFNLFISNISTRCTIRTSGVRVLLTSPSLPSATRRGPLRGARCTRILHWADDSRRDARALQRLGGLGRALFVPPRLLL